MNTHPPTIIVDLDGVICRHQDPQSWYDAFDLLPGVLEKFKEWWDQHACIIIISGRPECLRRHVVDELVRLRVFYHQLILGTTSGQRIVINDLKPYDPIRPTVLAVNLPRNFGLTEVGDHG